MKTVSLLLAASLAFAPLAVRADGAPVSAAGGTIPPAQDPAQGTDPNRLLGDPVPVPDANTPDKSQYNLFNPVPDDQERALSTDRPGKTHSSITVDPGHFQVESDFANYTYDHYSPGSTTTRSLSIATPILKAGVTDWADVELAFDLYNLTHTTQRGTTPSATTTGNGFGDMQLGSKINLFGNDGGAQALALLPFIKIPTASNNVGNGVVEYTLNVPYQINLDTLWSLTLEPAFGWLKNTENAAHHGDYSMLVNVNRPIFFKTLTASLELAGEYADHDQMPRYTLDPAVQWLVTENFQLDMGIYIGLNKAAPDCNPYVGVSYRY